MRTTTSFGRSDFGVFLYLNFSNWRSQAIRTYYLNVYLETLAEQGEHGPGWQSSRHIKTSSGFWTKLFWWYDRVSRAHISPQECGVWPTVYTGSRVFRQKQKYWWILSKSSTGVWQPGQNKTPFSEICKFENMKHFGHFKWITYILWEQLCAPYT